MIVDQISNANFYSGLPAGLVRAMEFLSRPDLADLPLGRTELDGDRLFALVQEYVPKPVEQGRWESHRKYHDVQFMLRGVERMGCVNLDRLTVSDAYDQAKDLIFYSSSPGDYFTLTEGSLAIFTPHDAHMPGIALLGASPVAKVRKIVMKVLV